MLVDNDMHVKIYLLLRNSNNKIFRKYLNKKFRINIHPLHFLLIKESNQVEYKLYEDLEVFLRTLMFVDIDLKDNQNPIWMLSEKIEPLAASKSCCKYLTCPHNAHASTFS